MRNKVVQIAVVLMIILVVSCKTKLVLNRTAVKPMRTKKILDSIEKYGINYNYFTLRFSGDFVSAKENQSIKGIIKIKKDSLIWISIVPALGIEAIRICLSADSVKMINRINSTYLTSDFAKLDSLYNLNIDFNTIQQILTNNIFEYPYFKGDDNLKTYVSKTDSIYYCLHSTRERRINHKVRKNKIGNLVYQQIFIDPLFYRVCGGIIKDFDLKREIVVDYKEFTTYNDIIFPKFIDLNFRNEKGNIAINLEATKVAINADSTFSFKIPEKYKPIDLQFNSLKE